MTENITSKISQKFEYHFRILQTDQTNAASIDFHSGEDILLQIRTEPDEEKIIFNDCINGIWREEYEVRISFHRTDIQTVKVEIAESSAEIFLWDGQTISFESDNLLTNTSKLSVSRNIEVSSEETPFYSEKKAKAAARSLGFNPKNVNSSNSFTGSTDETPQVKTGFLVQPKVKLDEPPMATVTKDQIPCAKNRIVGKVPEYVQIVLNEYNSVGLERIKTSLRPQPDRLNPIVISVVKNEIDRLHDFFRHYRLAGIERFAFIDNGSTDGTLEYILAQPDADVFQKIGPFEWKLKQGWINRAIASYGLDRWFMYLDADEHIVFDGSPLRTFRDLTSEMERRHIHRVRGFLIDMYADCPLLQSSYAPHSRLSEAYPFYDKDSYIEERYKEIISIKGGPRTRVFGTGERTFRPELTKYPLFCARAGEYMVNPHHNWPYIGNFYSERFLGILHYKFLPGVIEKIRAAVEAKNYWDGSFEYRCYLDVVENNPDVSLMSESSSRYTSSDELVAEGMIAPVGWPEDIAAPNKVRAAYLARRAEIECDLGYTEYRRLHQLT